MSTSAISKILLRQRSSQTLEVCVQNVPTGTTVDKAYFLVKENIADADGDAVIAKTIYPGETADGQITDQGSGGEATLEFIVDNDDVNSLSLSLLYMSAVKVILSNGLAYQPPYTRRPVRALPPVIEAVS